MISLPEGYTLSVDKAELQFDRVCALIRQTYWAAKRTPETIQKSLGPCLCYGIYYHGPDGDSTQVAFARVLTDYATTFYICDVIVDEAHRGKGLGKALVDAIVNDSRISHIYGMLITEDAQKLYEQFGFQSDPTCFMERVPPERAD